MRFAVERRATMPQGAQVYLDAVEDGDAIVWILESLITAEGAARLSDALTALAQHAGVGTAIQAAIVSAAGGY
jgi:hypothetical protein